MKRIFSFLLLTAFLLMPTAQIFADVWVNPYTRSDGTYVSGHYRSSPDGNPYNNWSYPGNTNPYTGVTAGGSSDSYLRNYYNNSSSYSQPSYNSGYTSTYTQPSYNSGYSSAYSTSYKSSFEDISHGYKSYGVVFCDYGYYEKNDKCIKKPANGFVIGTKIYCNYGYTLNNSDKCVPKSEYTSNNYYDSYSSTDSCPTHSSESLSDSTKCTCDTGYEVNKPKTKCVKISVKKNDKLCQTDFGKKSEWSKEYNDEGLPLCTCKSKYEWNSDQSSCVKEKASQ